VSVPVTGDGRRPADRLRDGDGLGTSTAADDLAVLAGAALALGQPEIGQRFVSITVEPGGWCHALGWVRDELGCSSFNSLCGVEEPDAAAILVTAHLQCPEGRNHVLVRTRVPTDRRRLPSATGLFQVALRHERETHESVGVLFTGQPDLRRPAGPDGDEDPRVRPVTEVRPVRSLRPAGAGRAPGSGTSRPAVPMRLRPPGTPPRRTRGPA
jgi:NADH:ubiquinone oxidoreductase subunit C